MQFTRCRICSAFSCSMMKPLCSASTAFLTAASGLQVSTMATRLHLSLVQSSSCPWTMRNHLMHTRCSHLAAEHLQLSECHTQQDCAALPARFDGAVGKVYDLSATASFWEELCGYQTLAPPATDPGEAEGEFSTQTGSVLWCALMLIS